MKRCRDLAQVDKNDLDKNLVTKTLEMLSIDTLGLSKLDRQILETIIDKFKGGPVGLGTIAASLSEEASTLEEVNEPYLIQLGLIERTPRGRSVTEKAYEHFNINYPKA